MSSIGVERELGIRQAPGQVGGIVARNRLDPSQIARQLRAALCTVTSSAALPD